MRASGRAWFVGPVGAIARVVIDLGRVEGNRGIADACEGGLARVELGDCTGVNIVFRSIAVFYALEERTKTRAVDDLHSGPTPRGKLSATARELCARALRSANAPVLRMVPQLGALPLFESN
jgi:hypothetical protein